MEDPKKTPQTPGEPAPAAQPASGAQPAPAVEPAPETKAALETPADVAAQTAPPAAQAMPATPGQVPPQGPGAVPPSGSVPPQGPGTVPPPPGYVPPQGPGCVPPSGQPYYAAPSVAPASSGKAVGALVCGILSIIFSWSVIPGIVLGIVALVLASGASKLGLRDGKITAGRITAAIGLFFSVIVLVVVIVAGALIGSIVGNSDQIERAIENGYSDIYHDELGYGDSGYGGSDSAPFDPSTATEEELAVNDVVVAAADKLLSQDPQTMSAIAAHLDEEMRDMTEREFPPNGMSLTELGVDPTKLASWVLQNASYTVDDVYVYSAIGEADATVTFTVPDDAQFASAFSTAYYAKVSALDPASPTYLDDSKAAVGQALDDAMAATTGTAEVRVYNELDLAGGSWTLENDWYEDLFDGYLY